MFLVDEDRSARNLLEFGECQTIGYQAGDDFWCIVSAVFKSPCSDDGRVLVLKYSEDAAYHCIFEDDDAEDCGLDCSWWKHPMPEGIYHLKVKPWAEQDAFTGEWGNGVRVLKHKLLCEL